MITKALFKTLLFIGIVFTIFSCSSTDEESLTPNNNNPINPAELKLFVIDSAKINTISSLGTNEITILNRKVNSSSYIKQLSIGPNAEKIAYIDSQNAGNPSFIITNSLRVVNANGSNDTELFSTTDHQIIAIKYCTDGKIHFAKRHNTTNAVKFGTINADGTGLQEATGYYGSIVDITNDRKYILLEANTLSATPNVQIIDLSLDGGAGEPYHTENFAGVDPYQIREGNFTQDGKYAVIPFKDGSDIKIRIVDMATKTATTKVIVTGITGWASLDVELASDSNRGVLTVMGENFTPKTNTYLFKLNDTVITNFLNNDDTVLNVYPY